jgi:23S rRNA pseudouridine1911/1915/1917 synthase
MLERWTLTVSPEQAGSRLDAFCAAETGVSRARIADWVASAQVWREDRKLVKPSFRITEGEVWTVEAPAPAPLDTVAESMALDIVFEDDQVVVVNKPSGLVVHPAAGHATGTLVNGLLAHCDDLDGVGDVLRPGIVHRIDKETSGLIVVTKTNGAHATLSEQFAQHTVRRNYLLLCARVSGQGLEDRGTIETTHARHPVDRKRFTGRLAEGKRAVTHYEVRERFRDGAMLVACRLETGRTHQIRMHLSEAGCPLLGDEMYGGRSVAETALIDRVGLHAATLGFCHPDGRELDFEASLPDDFAAALAALRAGRTWRKPR